MRATGVMVSPVSVDFDQEQSGQLPQPGVFDGLAYQWAVGGDHHLDQVLSPMLPDCSTMSRRSGNNRGPRIRMKTGAQRRARKSDSRDFEQAHGPQQLGELRPGAAVGTRVPRSCRLAGIRGGVGGWRAGGFFCAVRAMKLSQLALRHERGAGADQRTHATQDGEVAQRDQQSGRRDLASTTPVDHHRHEHRHQGGIEDERGCAEQRRRETGQGAPFVLSPAEQHPADPIQQADPAQRRRHGEQAGDGQHRLIGETREASSGDTTPRIVSPINAPNSSRSVGCSRRNISTVKVAATTAVAMYGCRYAGITESLDMAPTSGSAAGRTRLGSVTSAAPQAIPTPTTHNGFRQLQGSS